MFGGDPAALAGFLGIPAPTLQSELSQPGATQASVAARHGKPRDQLKAFLIEQNRKTLADAVASGKLTQAQATQLQSQIAADIDKMIDSPGFGAGSAGQPVFVGPGPGR